MRLLTVGTAQQAAGRVEAGCRIVGGRRMTRPRCRTFNRIGSRAASVRTNSEWNTCQENNDEG